LKLLLCFVVIIGSYGIAYSQVRQSPTPITVNLVTPTPFTNQQVVATVTPTFTPTAKGPVLLEVRESAGNVNVRAEPDPNSDRLGNIEFGTQYPVLRQYFLWYEFQYELSPSGRAWVYGELVDIIGDETEIEIIDTLVDSNTQIDTDVDQITQTAIAITSIPGALETATASARILSVPTLAQDTESQLVQDSIPLPTFTYPVDAVVSLATPNSDLVATENRTQETGGLPPLFPIIMLGGFGLIGLVISSLRS